jgi:hypothetical protein
LCGLEAKLTHKRTVDQNMKTMSFPRQMSASKDFSFPAFSSIAARRDVPLQLETSPKQTSALELRANAIDERVAAIDRRLAAINERLAVLNQTVAVAVQPAV